MNNDCLRGMQGCGGGCWSGRDGMIDGGPCGSICRCMVESCCYVKTLLCLSQWFCNAFGCKWGRKRSGNSGQTLDNIQSDGIKGGAIARGCVGDCVWDCAESVSSALPRIRWPEDARCKGVHTGASSVLTYSDIQNKQAFHHSRLVVATTQIKTIQFSILYTIP